ncbi:MAG: hypothetical protein JWP52_1147, partial [Rhizobacter sp.]|nr:hypothetical protein [Rhizobacter sp.]
LTLYAVFHTAQDSSTWQRRLPHS